MKIRSSSGCCTGPRGILRQSQGKKARRERQPQRPLTGHAQTDARTPRRGSHTTRDPRSSWGSRTGAKRSFETQISRRNTARGTTSNQATKPSSCQENRPFVFFFNLFLSLSRTLAGHRAFWTKAAAVPPTGQKSRDRCVLVCLFSTNNSFPRPPPKTAFRTRSRVGLKFRSSGTNFNIFLLKGMWESGGEKKGKILYATNKLESSLLAE